MHISDAVTSPLGLCHPWGTTRTFTVSTGHNGVGLINKSHEYGMAEQTLILP